MAYDFEEVPGSRRGNSERITRQYYVFDATNAEEDITDFVAAQPVTMAGLPFADFDYEETEDIEDEYLVTLNWGTPQNAGQPGQSIATLEYKFNFQAPSAHIYQSLATISLTPDPALGPDEGGAADDDIFGGAINVVSDGGEYRVEGLNLSTPHETFTLSYRASGGVIDGDYQLLVESLVGKVNEYAFRGRPAGSLMLTRATGGRDTGNVWYIEFGFGYIPNATNIPVGPITVAAKDGWDLLWTFYGNRKNASANGMVKAPLYALVERVFYRADFNLLDLPA